MPRAATAKTIRYIPGQSDWPALSHDARKLPLFVLESNAAGAVKGTAYGEAALQEALLARQRKIVRAHVQARFRARARKNPAHMRVRTPARARVRARAQLRK